MLTVRPACWPTDISPLAAIDTSFHTDRIYRVDCNELSFSLMEELRHVYKRYTFHPDDPAERDIWDCAIIAEHDGQVAGFMAAVHEHWNNRIVISHLYVDVHFRGMGIGTRLIDEAGSFGSSVQARCLWLETQNVNYPAITFYRHAGFELCGLDISLYDPAQLPSQETALFFTRTISPLP